MKHELSYEEMADCLPGDVGRLDDTRSRLICVQEILRTLTDSEHGLTANDIREIIKLRSWQSGKAPSEPAVLSDLHALIESDLDNFSVEQPFRGDNRGFRCTKKTLSSAQARLLLNSVRTCKFITLEECRDLCDAIEEMLSIYEQDRITADIFVDERVRPSQPRVFETADTIIEAIHKKRKIRFEYIFYGFDGKEHCVETENGDSYFEETPIDLIFSFGNYYVETWPATNNNDGPRKHYSRRLNRIRNVSISDTPAERNEYIRDLKRSAKSRIPQTFDMYGDGQSRDLFLEIDQNAVNTVIDHFGHDCKFEHVSEDAETGRKQGYARVVVQLAPTFYRWLFGMGDLIKIVPPENVLWAKSGSWGRKKSSGKTISELQQDYKSAIEGYKAQMTKAMSPYLDHSE